MPKIGLAAYACRVIDRSSGKPLRLDSFTPDGLDFFELVDRYFKQSRKIEVLDESEKAYRTHEIGSDGRFIHGSFKSGNYGIDSDIVDLRTGKEAHHRTQSQAEQVPFFFGFDCPKGEKLAIALLQTYGNFGIVKPFKNTVQKRFHKSFRNHYMSVEPMVPIEVIDQYLKGGTIARVTFIRKSIPKDIADSLEDDVKESDAQAEYHILPKKSGNKLIRLRESLRNFMIGRTTISEVATLKGFEHQNIILKIEKGKQVKTINLSNLEAINPSYDLTNQVETELNGHPKYRSIYSAARNLSGELRQMVGRS